MSERDSIIRSINAYFGDFFKNDTLAPALADVIVTRLKADGYTVIRPSATLLEELL